MSKREKKKKEEIKVIYIYITKPRYTLKSSVNFKNKEQIQGSCRKNKKNNKSSSMGNNTAATLLIMSREVLA